MRLLRRQTLAFVLVLLTFVVVFALWSRLPDPVPIHWNIRGEVDGYCAKPWGPLFMPLTSLATSTLLAFVPAFSPKSRPIEKFERVYGVIVAAVAGFMFLTTLLMSLSAIGVAFDMANAVGAVIGLLFVILGNLFGKVTKNPYVGIRTPWTLASEDNWFRTHRLGGKLFVGAGLGALIAAMFGYALWAFLPLALIAGVVPVVYSYLLSRRGPR